MIRESVYFLFDNRKSSDFAIVNVNVGSGLYEESISSSKTIHETYPRDSFKPFLFGVQKQPKQFTLSFAFLETWNDQLIDEVTRWLSVDDYKPLAFESNLDRVFYAMPVEDINLIHNGLKQGYLTLTVRCDSAYSYSHEITTPWYELNANSNSDLVELDNHGHYPYFPYMWIEKIADGDIIIHNLSNKNSEFKLTNVAIGEKLFIDNMNEIIETDKEGIFNYDNFNDNYLEIVYGKNILKASKNIRIKFRYQNIFS